MASTYLRLLQTLAQATGSRQALAAPAVQEPIVSIPMGDDGGSHSHFVFDPGLSRQILRRPQAYRQDRSLAALLSDSDPDRVRWVQLFVEHSPEYLDGEHHVLARRSVGGAIDRFASATAALPITDLTERLQQGLNTAGTTALSLARSIVRLRFGQILELELGRPVTLPDALLFGPDIFSPSIRIRASVHRINALSDQFLQESLTPDQRDDPALVVPILTLFYMGSTPLLANLTALFNTLIQPPAAGIDPETFIGFDTIPTNFLAREAMEDDQLAGRQIRRGDNLYLMLFESSGCPFRRAVGLPFGHGRHRCPGAELSRVLMRQCLDAVVQIPATAWASLTPSTLQAGRGSAFLVFEDP
jgi:cytochrome P450